MFLSWCIRRKTAARVCLESVFFLAFTFVTTAIYAQDSQNPLDSPITLTKEEEESLQKETLEDILPGIDESQRFLYEPEGRRDPFQSLLFGMNLENVIRPAGIEGMNIAEIILVGILNWGEKGRIALFLGSDDKTYQRKVGDSVFDGKIIAIDKGTVLFEQKVYDPFGNEKPPKRIEIKLHPKKEEGL